jgi:gamma-glutamyl-gamma-aminobutyraldehyde dehydrogenase/4-guanidinobutyraldehyde dehydrogenase/NAD-dependent aldehyde dehydrogenase
VPWNFPLLMASWKLGPALAMGNSVVLKPAEQSPLTAIRLAELAAEAGLPAGVLQVVPGFGETAGQAIGRHPDVDMVAFTGSTEVGKLFLRYAGESNMKRIALECGGKSPHVVLPDSDLDSAATGIAWGVFYNQGEVCNAGSRLLVHESVKDELLEKVVAVSERIRPGDPLDPKTRMGAIVDEIQLDRVLGYIESGKGEGAGLHLGGNRVLEETGGYFVEPTIFDAVRNDMRIAQEEIFGPVLSTIGFTEEDEAIRIANDTIYGLSAAVWTNDVTKAHRYARALRAGVVWVNTFDAGDITSPFGGFKQSGFGRDKSIHAIEKYADLKAIWIAV